MAGEYLAGSYFQSVDTEANRRYLKLLREFRNTAPVTTDSMEAGYVAVHLWAQAVGKAGSAQVTAVRKTLGGQSYDGPGGLTRVWKRTAFAPPSTAAWDRFNPTARSPLSGALQDRYRRNLSRRREPGNNGKRS